MTEHLEFPNIWINASTISEAKFVCACCGMDVASTLGYPSANPNVADGSVKSKCQAMYICPNCNAPNVFDHNNLSLVVARPGVELCHTPFEIHCIYNEIRDCIKARAYTAAVMLMRKLLMNIAVDIGANKGANFTHYVDFLEKKNIVGNRLKHMYDKIKKNGNIANHEIEPRSKTEAVELFKFIEILLIQEYETDENGNLYYSGNQVAAKQDVQGEMEQVGRPNQPMQQRPSHNKNQIVKNKPKHDRANLNRNRKKVIQ